MTNSKVIEQCFKIYQQICNFACNQLRIITMIRDLQLQVICTICMRTSNYHLKENIFLAKGNPKIFHLLGNLETNQHKAYYSYKAVFMSTRFTKT